MAPQRPLLCCAHSMDMVYAAITRGALAYSSQLRSDPVITGDTIAAAINPQPAARSRAPGAARIETTLVSYSGDPARRGAAGGCSQLRN